MNYDVKQNELSLSNFQIYIWALELSPSLLLSFLSSRPVPSLFPSLLLSSFFYSLISSSTSLFFDTVGEKMLQGGGLREEKVHQLIWRVFTKGNGLTLKTEAVTYLKERLGGPNASLGEAELLAALSCIATEYRRGGERPALVDQQNLASVIEDMLRMSVDSGHQPELGHGHEQVGDLGVGTGRPAARTFVQAVNAADCPRWEYRVTSKSFQHRQQERRPVLLLVGEAQEKIEMYRRHFEIVRQRVLRSEEFSGPNAVRVRSRVRLAPILLTRLSPSPLPPLITIVALLHQVNQGTKIGRTTLSPGHAQSNGGECPISGGF